MTTNAQYYECWLYVTTGSSHKVKEVMTIQEPGRKLLLPLLQIVLISRGLPTLQNLTTVSDEDDDHESSS